MSDFALMLDFIRNIIITVWTIFTSYWFMFLPFVAFVAVGIFKLILAITPNNDNRKH